MSFSIKHDPLRTAKSWKSTLLFHAKLPWCHEQPLVSMSEMHVGRDWNDTKNQRYGYYEKAFFELYLILCLIKLYFKIIFWIALAMKYKKKSL